MPEIEGGSGGEEEEVGDTGGDAEGEIDDDDSKLLPMVAVGSGGG